MLAAGAPGAYNIAADDVVSVVDVARELGLRAAAGARRSGAARRPGLISRLPFLPPQLQWVEAASHPAIMDTTRARTELGWKPRYTALEALRDTLD